MAIDPIMATKLLASGVTKTAIAQLRRKRFSKKAADEARQAQDEIVYQESMTLLRNVLTFCCRTTVEDLHAVTNIVSPSPPWVHSEEIEIPSVFINRAAELVQAQLGPNLDKVGKTWWQWRKVGSTIKSHWYEMKADYKDRKARNDPGTRVILYLHGGAYYLGGVGHDLQVQRHARKLKGRCFAPRYRLAPQFPFPCAVHDVLSVYLYLITIVQPSHVVIAGDSAGGGLCLALLLIIRDQGLPMPAGASLISPWVDLMHSFPSITAPTEYDYVPVTGFHAKDSLAWPPPPTDQMPALGIKRNPKLPPDYVIDVNGQPLTITEQINMYAQNSELIYPLVSPVHAASLGGFCPCQVLVGGGEILRDEQIYLAHKMANPTKYVLSDLIVLYNSENREDRFKHPPTDVQLLIFDDGPHAAPTLGHIDVAKFQYRAISQFTAWALAKAQNTEVKMEHFVANPASERLDNNNLLASGGGSPPPLTADLSAPLSPTPPPLTVNKGNPNVSAVQETARANHENSPPEYVDYGSLRAGWPLPPFEDYMQRFRVTRQGDLYPLEPPEQIPCLNLPIEEVGAPKEATLSGWIKYKGDLNRRFASEKKKSDFLCPTIFRSYLSMHSSTLTLDMSVVYKQRVANTKKGYVPLPNGEIAPPTALVGRRVVGEAVEMEVPVTGLANSFLAKLFPSVDYQGATPAGTARGWADSAHDQGTERERQREEVETYREAGVLSSRSETRHASGRGRRLRRARKKD